MAPSLTLVIVPDFLEGKPMQMAWYARDTEEKRENIDFMKTRTNPKPLVDLILGEGSMMSELKTEFPEVESWGAIGNCWGGKIVSLASVEGTPFTVVVQTSPAMVDPRDAKAAAAFEDL
jgi:dienelactone hydrolase